MYLVRSIHEMAKVYAFDAAYEIEKAIHMITKKESMTAEEVVGVIENLQAAEIPTDEKGETMFDSAFLIEWQPASNLFLVESHWEITTP